MITVQFVVPLRICQAREGGGSEKQLQCNGSCQSQNLSWAFYWVACNRSHII